MFFKHELTNLYFKGGNIMSIVRMDSSYHDEVINIFGQDIKKFYFIISDMQRNNYTDENFKVFGEFEEGKLQSILLNNFSNLTYYAKTDRNVNAYKEVIPVLAFKKISGPNSLVEKLIPFVNIQSDRLSYMGYVEKIDIKRKYPHLQVKYVNTDEEIGMQYDLLLSAKEYLGVMPDSKEKYIAGQRKIINTNSRTAYLLVDNKMVSSCSTTSEYDKSAIVTGVVTSPEYRNRGYSSEVLICLFEALINEGKYPYLFYSNPAARRVYINLGMEEVCEWRVVFTK
jgi:uncharacterized protein